MTLRDKIFAELDRREEQAQMADEAKPGVWVASRTHDGVVWTNRSHVYSEHRHEGGYGSRGVAHLIIDDLADNTWPTRPVGEDPPQPAVVAEYIAAHGPADALRRYAAARRVLDRHQPEHWGTDEDRTDDGPITCKHCGWDEEAYPGDLGETDYPCHEVIDVADSLGIDTGSTHG